MRRSLAPFSKPESSVQTQSSADIITIYVRVYVFGTHKGLLDVNVPSCASCHGPKAKGDGEFPYLACAQPDQNAN
jgi:mono/diheme cytochrome c family protein